MKDVVLNKGMNDPDGFDLTRLLFSFVNRTYQCDGRTVKVLSLVSGPEESYFVCVWTDTCVAFCETLYNVGVAMEMIR